MASSKNTRRTTSRPADAGRSRVRAFGSLAALLSLAVALGIVAVAQLAKLRGDDARATPVFLTEALGAAKPSAPLVRKTPTGTARVRGSSLVVEDTTGKQVGLRATGIPATGAWTRHEYGVIRPTGFGSEALTIGTELPEHFLSVSKRHGVKTWTWKLDTALRAQLLGDGGVGFFDPKTHRVSDLTIAPVAIYDREGDDVTPDGIRWRLGTDRTTLELRLNDATLPEPYVIDPAFMAVGTVAAATAATTIVLPSPAGEVPGDIFIATIGVSAPTATFTIAAPAGWSLVSNE